MRTQYIEGFEVFDTINLNSFEIITSTKYIGLDYTRLSQVVDFVVLMPYEWGNTIGIPTGFIAFDTLKNYLDYMSKHITPEKLIIGIPILGYIWERPYTPGITRGLSITNRTAVELASNFDATILYDEITKSSYFQYIAKKEYIVRFRDARSVDAHLELIPEYGLAGVGIWNIMSYFAQMGLVINSQYVIDDIL